MPYMDCMGIVGIWQKEGSFDVLSSTTRSFLGILIALSGFRLAGHPGKKTVDTTFTQQKRRNHVLMGFTSTSLHRIGWFQEGFLSHIPFLDWLISDPTTIYSNPYAKYYITPLYVPGSKVLVLRMVIPPLIGNPYNGYIHPYEIGLMTIP